MKRKKHTSPPAKKRPFAIVVSAPAWTTEEHAKQVRKWDERVLEWARSKPTQLLSRAFHYGECEPHIHFIVSPRPQRESAD